MSPVGPYANSWVCSFATTIAPASISRATTGASTVAGAASFEDQRAAAGGQPGDVDEVLDPDGDAVQRAPHAGRSSARARRPGERAVGVERDHQLKRVGGQPFERIA